MQRSRRGRTGNNNLSKYRKAIMNKWKNWKEHTKERKNERKNEKKREMEKVRRNEDNYTEEGKDEQVKDNLIPSTAFKQIQLL